MNIGYVLFALAALAFAFAGFVAVAVIAWKLLGGGSRAAVRSSTAATLIRPPAGEVDLRVTLEDLVEDFDRRNANEAFAVETRAKLAARIAKMLGDELPDPKA